MIQSPSGKREIVFPRPHHPGPIRAIALGLAVLLSSALPVSGQTLLYPGLAGTDLLDAVRADFRPPATLGYDVARDSLFAWEQRTQGRLCGVYSGFCITLTPGADPSTDAFQQGINTEHTWPQSFGAGVEPSRSDLHHLFPTRDAVNSARGNLPFDEIPEADADAWYRLADSQADRPTVFLGEWSTRQNAHPSPLFSGRFEPRDDHKGNAARAVFYVRAVYPDRVAAAGADEFFEVQRVDLLAWARFDPVDEREAARNAWIATRQGTANPFVLDSTLARRAFQTRIDAGGGPPLAYSNLVWLNEIHYDNAGPDVGEFVEVAVPVGIAPASVTLTLYNGNGGVPYGTSETADTFVAGEEAGGVRLYTRTYPSNGLQNGAPDGLALSVDGEVVQFLSYEGVFEASAGPALGLTSVDLGVSESDQTPAGFSLQLRGSGNGYADFAWAAPSAASPGTFNAGQSLTVVATEPVAASRPGLALRLAGPNPFRGTTAVAVRLAEPAADARVEVFDVVGRRVAVLFEGPLGSGERLFVIDRGAMTPGVYLVRALAGGSDQVLRIVIGH